MNSLTRPAKRPLPFGASAAAVIGWAGGGIVWVISGIWTDTSSTIVTFGRLDQFTMLLLGAVVGALVLAARARHRRNPVAAGLLAGILLGGVPALLGATLVLLLPFGDTPRLFFVLRILGWSLAAGLASGGLACYTRHREWGRIVESILLGMLGGAISAAIYTLPGPAELWQAMAATWFGAAVGISAVGPTLWHAPALVQVLARHQTSRGLLALHECPVENGGAMLLGEAQIACDADRVFVYPPAGGVIINGQPCYRPVRLMGDALLSVGRMRFRIQLSAPMLAVMFCLLTTALNAQSQAVANRLQLIRCLPNTSTECLRFDAPPLPPLTMAAPLQATSSLARTAWTSDLLSRSDSNPAAHLRVTWRPPLFALPVFSGTADSAAITVAIRDLVAGSNQDEHFRLLITLLLAMGGLALWMLVPHFAWGAHSNTENVILDEKLLREMTRSRGIELQLGPAPNETTPRRPDEITAQTARRTALER